MTTGTVRVGKRTAPRDDVVDELLVREQVRVRRVPVGRLVDGPVPDRHVDGRVIVSVLEEVPVVVRRLRLVEELQRERQTVRPPQHVTARREEPIIERKRGPRASLPKREHRTSRR